MNFLIKWLLPLIETTAATELVVLLQQWHDGHPATYSQFLVAFYPLIDVQLENYVKSTGKKVPIEIVTKLKSVIEQSAAANLLPLPNLDAGTIND